MYSKNPGIPIVSDSTDRRAHAEKVTATRAWEAGTTKRNST